MELHILNKLFQKTDVVDVFESLVWTDRYNESGDFELIVQTTTKNLSRFKEDYYVTLAESDRVMIIDTIEMRVDEESGSRMIVKGRSLESILDRRILLRQYSISEANLQDTISLFLTENVINSSQSLRNIPNFSFLASTDPIITAKETDGQYDGDNLLTTIQNLCQIHSIGFKVLLTSTNGFQFSLYAGVDRSFNQSTNPYVIFSPDYDNLLRSTFLYSKRYKKTYVLVYGDPTSGPAHRMEAALWDDGIEPTGMNRRETSLDASDMSKFVQGTTTEIDPGIYTISLRERGFQFLHQEHKEVLFFDAEINQVNSYKYREDFFLGDIVQLVDHFGHDSTVRIKEVVFSQNTGGISIYPMYETL